MPINDEQHRKMIADGWESRGGGVYTAEPLLSTPQELHPSTKGVLKMRAWILYLDDETKWTQAVGRILEKAGYSVILFNDLSQARGYYEEHDHEISLVLCDGSIDDPNDGRNWAIELHAAGKKAVVLSTEPAKGVPFVSKLPLEEEELLHTIEEVLKDQ